MRRARTPELMDDPGLDAGEHARALRALNRVNRILGVDRGLWRAITALFAGRVESILDIGAGGGGFLGYVAAQDWGIALRVALDRSTVALQQAICWQTGVIRCVTADALRIPLADDSVDVVTGSLFLHHFDPPQVEVILREAARVARLGVVMGDLTRSRIALLATWAATRLVSRSRVFQVDGPRSVRAAFTIAELREMALRGGLHGVTMARSFPFRCIMKWSKV